MHLFPPASTQISSPAAVLEPLNSSLQTSKCGRICSPGSSHRPLRDGYWCINIPAPFLGRITQSLVQYRTIKLSHCTIYSKLSQDLSQFGAIYSKTQQLPTTITSDLTVSVDDNIQAQLTCVALGPGHSQDCSAHVI